MVQRRGMGPQAGAVGLRGGVGVVGVGSRFAGGSRWKVRRYTGRVDRVEGVLSRAREDGKFGRAHLKKIEIILSGNVTGAEASLLETFLGSAEDASIVEEGLRPPLESLLQKLERVERPVRRKTGEVTLRGTVTRVGAMRILCANDGSVQLSFKLGDARRGLTITGDAQARRIPPGELDAGDRAALLLALGATELPEPALELVYEFMLFVAQGFDEVPLSAALDVIDAEPLLATSTALAHSTEQLETLDPDLGAFLRTLCAARP